MMRVLIWGVCLAVCSLGSLPAVAIPVISVQPQDTVVGLGDYFTVDIVITDVVDLYGVDLDVLFDTAIMDCVSYTSGSFLASGGSTYLMPPAPTPDEIAGILEQYVETLMGPPNGVSGSGVLLSITFQATNMGTGLVDIGAELADSFSLPIEYGTQAGTVNVIPEPASMAMLGSMGVGLLVMRRRRKNKH